MQINMKNLNKIKLNSGILKNQGVGLVVFGSKVTGAEHPKSDIDIDVVFFEKIFNEAIIKIKTK